MQALRQPSLRRFIAWMALTVALALVAAVRPAGAVQVDFLPKPDPDDGKTFRVLCFHDIRDNLRASFETLPDAFAVDTKMLTNMFSWIQANGYHPVTLAQIDEARRGGKPLPKRPILLTFDDGYESHYTKVFPLLKQFRFPAVFGLVTEWTNAPPGAKIKLSNTQIVDRDFFMNWNQIREMQASGLVEFATHTHDMHHGALGNPQGNEMPTATTHEYLPKLGRYETDDEYRKRVRGDLQRSVDIIQKNVGTKVQTVVWPYGAHNLMADQEAANVGLKYMLTLEPGPNTPDVPLTAIRRSLMGYDTNTGDLERSLREPVTHHGMINPVQRVVHVDMDYIYDPDPKQQEANLGKLIDRIKDLAPRVVYLQAFADPKGNGAVDAVYFPNRHMPMRADLFSRVSWQLKTRAKVEVYAWLPMLSYKLPANNPAATHLVQSVAGAPQKPGTVKPPRLSPFDPQARQMIRDIYEDLAKNATIDGILFHDDGVLDDYEDASPAALKAYEAMGLPGDINQIRQSPELMQKWSRAKTAALISFSKELISVAQGYQNGRDMLTARNIFAGPVLDPKAETWTAQNYDDFLEAYDYVALEAMPYMEEAKDPKDWMKKLTAAVAKHKDGLKKTIFELQAVDWRNQDKPIPSTELRDQMRALRSAGALNYGYYPDDFIAGRPDTEVLREVMSLKTYIETRKPAGGDKGSVEKLNSSSLPQSQPPNAGVDRKPATTEAATSSNTKAGG
ncbi:poly-beta-1,6-N-acetyl-D-glucosamine N-deacetylase PgaB [Ralstonia flatus]